MTPSLVSHRLYDGLHILYAPCKDVDPACLLYLVLTCLLYLRLTTLIGLGFDADISALIAHDDIRNSAFTERAPGYRMQKQARYRLQICFDLI